MVNAEPDLSATRGPLAEWSDTALVAACGKGDHRAWETLVARYQRLVWAVARRAGLDDERAAEVFQQVFVTLVEHIGRIEQPERLSAWLVTTARREVWRSGRLTAAARGRTFSTDQLETFNEPLDPDPLPGETLERLEQQHAVRRAVSALDERCRRLLTLLFYQPNPPPYAEIAAALGTSEGSIGPTRARCLQKLRQALADAER